MTRQIPIEAPGQSFILAFRPGAWPQRHHLFRRPGERSLCELFDWLQVQRAQLPVWPKPWICADCQAAS